MTKLKELVPPLHLCKLIPDGEFEESYFAWCDFNEDFPEYKQYPAVVVREISWAATSKKGVFPAPTLEEIMAKLPPYAKNEHILACCVPDWADFNARIFGEHWRVGYTGDASINDKSPSTAALKLWLKFKGIDVQNSAEIEQ